MVVGAGIVGAACAYYAARAGLSVTLIERNTVGSGTTSRGEGKGQSISESVFDSSPIRKPSLLKVVRDDRSSSDFAIGPPSQQASTIPQLSHRTFDCQKPVQERLCRFPNIANNNTD